VFDAELDGDVEVAEEGLVLRHVVGRGEVQAHHIADVLSEGSDEEQAHACAHFSHRVKVQGPALSLDLKRGQLSVNPFGDEVRQDL
jgi:hypothetical protein